MRTITVVFTEKKKTVFLNEMSSYKKYKFLCNYNTIVVGVFNYLCMKVKQRLYTSN